MNSDDDDDDDIEESVYGIIKVSEELIGCLSKYVLG